MPQFTIKMPRKQGLNNIPIILPKKGRGAVDMLIYVLVTRLKLFHAFLWPQSQNGANNNQFVTRNKFGYFVSEIFIFPNTKRSSVYSKLSPKVSLVVLMLGQALDGGHEDVVVAEEVVQDELWQRCAETTVLARILKLGILASDDFHLP